MRPFLVEQDEKKNNKQFFLFLQQFIYVFITTGAACFVAFCAFLYLTIAIGTVCGDGAAQWLVIPQMLSYIAMILYSGMALYMVTGGVNLKIMSYMALIIQILKFWSLIAAFRVLNRNWGNCYVTKGQGIMFCVDNLFEIPICLALYQMTRQVYFKLVNSEMLHILTVKGILSVK